MTEPTKTCTGYNGKCYHPDGPELPDTEEYFSPGKTVSGGTRWLKTRCRECRRCRNEEKSKYHKKSVNNTPRYLNVQSADMFIEK